MKEINQIIYGLYGNKIEERYYRINYIMYFYPYNTCTQSKQILRDELIT